MKYCIKQFIDFIFRSHPVRGAWIEMLAEKVAYIDRMIVAPRQGCVD